MYNLCAPNSVVYIRSFFNAIFAKKGQLADMAISSETSGLGAKLSLLCISLHNCLSVN
jgi:hypothetical protein